MGTERTVISGWMMVLFSTGEDAHHRTAVKTSYFQLGTRFRVFTYFDLGKLNARASICRAGSSMDSRKGHKTGSGDGAQMGCQNFMASPIWQNNIICEIVW